MKMVIVGGGDLSKAIKKYSDHAQSSAEETIRTTALAVESDAIKSIQRGSKTGIKYKRGGVVHTSSAPGEAPATDTGELVGSIKAIIKSSYAVVGTDKVHGAYLEFGTQNMDERPWLRPARLKNMNTYVELLAKSLLSFK